MKILQEKKFRKKHLGYYSAMRRDSKSLEKGNWISLINVKQGPLEKILLVKTIDLFAVAKYLNENDDKAFQKDCRDAIHKGLGKW